MKIGFLNPHNQVFRPLGKLADILILSVCWLFGSLFIVTFGALTTALYDAIVRSLRGDERHAVGRFFRVAKKHFKSGSLSGIIVLVTWVGFLLLRNYAVRYILPRAGQEAILYGVVLVLLLWVLSLTTWIFPLLSRFEFNMVKLWQTAAKLVVVHPLRSLALSVMTFGAILVINRWLFLIWTLFLVPGILEWFSSYLVEPVFAHYDGNLIATLVAEREE